jgi:hypothetical protein
MYSTAHGYTTAAHTTQTGVWVGEGEGEGLSITGSASENPEARPAFTSSSYPAVSPVTQSMGAPLMLRTASGNVKCKAFSAEVGLSQRSSVLGLAESSFRECTAFGQSATVGLRSCSFGLSLANVGPPYSGSLSIACGAGDAIEVSVPTAKCSVTVAAQTAGSVGFENRMTSGKNEVSASLNVTGLNYGVTSSAGKSEGVMTTCGTVGAHSGGSLTGELEL